MKKYTSPFSKSELRYFQTLMQNDTKAEGRGATYAKLEILLREGNRWHRKSLYTFIKTESPYLIKGSNKSKQLTKQEQTLKGGKNELFTK